MTKILHLILLTVIFIGTNKCIGQKTISENDSIPKIFNQFLGSSYETAVANAVENSKKNALFIVLASDDLSFTQEIKRIVRGHIASGRERIFIILADKVGDERNSAAIVANGKQGGIWMQNEKNVTYKDTAEISNRIGKLYDEKIK